MPNFLLDFTILAMFMIAIYAFIFLPRQLNFRRTQKYVKEGLEVGTEVVTYGGMIGKVTEIKADEGIVHLEIAPNIEIRVLSASIASHFNPEMIAENAQKGQN